MHPSCRRWVESKVAELDLADSNTLEVGSFNVNGGIDDLFTGSYLGVDMRAGPGVDLVMDADTLTFDNDEFEVVISTEMLEHASRPWRAMAEMARVCISGGHVLISARGFDTRGAFQLHDYPGDYWRLGPGAMEILTSDAGLEVVECRPDEDCPGWFLTARKP